MPMSLHKGITMLKVNTKILKKGDIILTTSKKFQSNIIKLFTWSDISHAMLYVAHSSVIDSTGDGVHARNIEKMFYNDKCAIYVLRLKESISDEKLDKVISFIRGRVGTTYSPTEAAISITKPNNSGSDKQFCSRLVARAYASIGIYFCDKPDHCTPKDLKNSPLLEIIPNPFITVSPEEEKYLKEAGDSTDGMRKVTNLFLKKVRRINPHIEDITAAVNMVIENPKFDNAVSQALKDSGYLDYWKVEEERFPWRYDIKKMIQYHFELNDDQLIIYSQSVLEDEANGTFNHWKIGLISFTHAFKQKPSETTKLLVFLYENLNLQIIKRITTATKFIKWYKTKEIYK